VLKEFIEAGIRPFGRADVRHHYGLYLGFIFANKKRAPHSGYYSLVSCLARQRSEFSLVDRIARILFCYCVVSERKLKVLHQFLLVIATSDSSVTSMEASLNKTIDSERPNSMHHRNDGFLWYRAKSTILVTASSVTSCCIDEPTRPLKPKSNVFVPRNEFLVHLEDTILTGGMIHCELEESLRERHSWL
jgi:hypothetical protein